MLWVFILFSVLPVSWATAQQRLKLDPVHSYFEFEVRTCLGRSIKGVFPRFEGEVVSLSEEREKVRLRLYTADAVIPGRPRYTDWIRGENFFDAQHYPTIEFESQSYSPRVILQGGKINGSLTIRGISREETLQIQPATCARPGYDCDVVSTGVVLRGRYGMESWRLVLGNRVTFRWHGRVIEGSPSP
ncbi:MAG TPA: YceI family protein [Xylella taiwanensis]